jgi:uncharacterized SAM-binding protein YcdF (DUF218 family)
MLERARFISSARRNAPPFIQLGISAPCHDGAFQFAVEGSALPLVQLCFRAIPGFVVGSLRWVLGFMFQLLDDFLQRLARNERRSRENLRSRITRSSGTSIDLALIH